MPNELILLINLLVVFGGVLLAYYLFGTRGLTCFYSIRHHRRQH